MISIVVCSINPSLYDDLSQSIEATIGLENYELIRYDNREDKRSIAEAYNIGLKKSKYNIVCFVHEDVLFHTPNWGLYLLEYFNSNPLLGIIGVAGSTLKLRAPSSWLNSPAKFNVINIIQHNEDKVYHDSAGWDITCESLREIVVADGVFLALRKIEGLFFNEQIPGFHGYDLSISLTYRAHGYLIYATNRILIEHFSIGTLDGAWVRAMYYVSKHYKKQLPMVLHNGSIRLHRLELDELIRFIHKAIDMNEKKLAYFCFLSYLTRRPFSFRNIIIAKRLIFR